jgi:hypothetical protein
VSFWALLLTVSIGALIVATISSEARHADEKPMSNEPQPPVPGFDRINRVVMHYSSNLPHFGVYVQLDNGTLVLYGLWIDEARAKFERLALERLLFEGKTTRPPVNFETQ